MKGHSIFIFLVTTSPIFSAPRSKENTLPQTVYDQKQSGDYNIQFHLKDFQVVALLSDDILGDYDYEYDYSDFTIKPSANVTLKPPPAPTEESVTENSSANPDGNSISSTTQVSSQKPETTTAEKNAENDSTEKTTSATPSTNTPGRIKVQIIQDPSPNIGIVPSDEIGKPSEAPALGEILHYRRCATGYTRDKKGRCRRVRRPGQTPFTISRLASSLASRFRQSSAESASSSQSLSTEK